MCCAVYFGGKITYNPAAQTIQNKSFWMWLFKNKIFECWVFYSWFLEVKWFSLYFEIEITVGYVLETVIVMIGLAEVEVQVKFSEEWLSSKSHLRIFSHSQLCHKSNCWFQPNGVGSNEVLYFLKGRYVNFYLRQLSRFTSDELVNSK